MKMNRFFWSAEVIGKRMAGMVRMIIIVALSFVVALGGLPPLAAEAAESAGAGAGVSPQAGTSLGNVPITINKKVTYTVHGNSSTSDGKYNDLSPMSNKVTIGTNGHVADGKSVYGAFPPLSYKSANMVGNQVWILGKIDKGSVYGALTYMPGDVTNNEVWVYGQTTKNSSGGGSVTGGGSIYSGHVDSNVVFVCSGSVVAGNVTGGGNTEPGSTANNNMVRIERGGKVDDYVGARSQVPMLITTLWKYLG